VNKAKPIDKSVLLYSGGLDSVLADYLFKPDLLLHVPTGAPYAARERDAVYALADKCYTTTSITILHGINLMGYQMPDTAVVPNRNAHLVLVASHYGDRIMLSSPRGDWCRDKDVIFNRLMGVLLKHMWYPSAWSEGRTFTVSNPLEDGDKAYWVGKYLEAGGPVEALWLSYSCYTGNSQPCGVCDPCMQKRHALTVNGLTRQGYFAKDPA
jgi:7-cyano-7-deazaguanine synthase in queuosine biosynthesis